MSESRSRSTRVVGSKEEMQSLSLREGAAKTLNYHDTLFDPIDFERLDSFTLQTAAAGHTELSDVFANTVVQENFNLFNNNFLLRWERYNELSIYSQEYLELATQKYANLEQEARDIQQKKGETELPALRHVLSGYRELQQNNQQNEFTRQCYEKIALKEHVPFPDPLLTEWKKHGRFALFNNKILYDTYKDIVEAKTFFESILEDIKEHNPNKNRKTSRLDEPYTRVKNILDEYLAKLIRAEEQIIHSMIARCKMTERYNNLRCDDIVKDTFQKVLEATNKSMPYLKTHDLILSNEIPSKALILLRRELTPELITAFQQCINAHTKTEIKNEAQQLAVFRLPTLFQPLLDKSTDPAVQELLQSPEIWFALNHTAQRLQHPSEDEKKAQEQFFFENFTENGEFLILAPLKKQIADAEQRLITLENKYKETERSTDFKNISTYMHQELMNLKEMIRAREEKFALIAQQKIEEGIYPSEKTDPARLFSTRVLEEAKKNEDLTPASASFETCMTQLGLKKDHFKNFKSNLPQPLNDLKQDLFNKFKEFHLSILLAQTEIDDNHYVDKENAELWINGKRKACKTIYSGSEALVQQLKQAAHKTVEKLTQYLLTKTVPQSQKLADEYQHLMHMHQDLCNALQKTAKNYFDLLMQEKNGKLSQSDIKKFEDQFTGVALINTNELLLLPLNQQSHTFEELGKLWNHVINRSEHYRTFLGSSRSFNELKKQGEALNRQYSQEEIVISTDTNIAAMQRNSEMMQRFDNRLINIDNQRRSLREDYLAQVEGATHSFQEQATNINLTIKNDMQALTNDLTERLLGIMEIKKLASTREYRAALNEADQFLKSRTTEFMSQQVTHQDISEKLSHNITEVQNQLHHFTQKLKGFDLTFGGQTEDNVFQELFNKLVELQNLQTTIKAHLTTRASAQATAKLGIFSSTTPPSSPTNAQELVKWLTDCVTATGGFKSVYSKEAGMFKLRMSDVDTFVTAFDKALSQKPKQDETPEARLEKLVRIIENACIQYQSKHQETDINEALITKLNNKPNDSHYIRMLATLLKAVYENAPKEFMASLIKKDPQRTKRIQELSALKVGFGDQNDLQMFKKQKTPAYPFPRIGRSSI